MQRPCKFPSLCFIKSLMAPPPQKPSPQENCRVHHVVTRVQQPAVGWFQKARCGPDRMKHQSTSNYLEEDHFGERILLLSLAAAFVIQGCVANLLFGVRYVRNILCLSANVTMPHNRLCVFCWCQHFQTPVIWGWENHKICYSSLKVKKNSSNLAIVQVLHELFEGGGGPVSLNGLERPSLWEHNGFCFCLFPMDKILIHTLRDASSSLVCVCDI